MSAFAGPSFSLEGVDDKSHPYLRGIRGVSQILQASSASAKKINDVYFSRPHMFIIFNEYKRLLAIDAAPTNLQANERQNQQIAKFLSGDVSELDSTLSSVLTSTHKTKIIDVFVYRGQASTKLYVLELSGQLSTWTWNLNEYKWDSPGTTTLIETSKQILKSAFVDGGESPCISWLIDEKEIQNAPLTVNWRSLATQDVSVKSITLHAVTQSSVQSIHTGSHGLWVLTSDSLGFVPFEDAAEMVDFSGVLDGVLNVSDIKGAFTHPSAKELCLLASDSSVFALSAKGGAPKARKLCTLNQKFDFSSEAASGPVLFAALSQYAIVLCKPSIRVYNIKTGTLVDSADFSTEYRVIPSGGMWKLAEFEDAAVGVWGFLGLWRLKFPSAADQAKLLAAKEDPAEKGLIQASEASFSVKSARLGPKYLLDLVTHLVSKARTTSSVDEEERETKALTTALQNLIPYLQNPTIIISLLANKTSLSNVYLKEQVSAWLSTFYAKKYDEHPSPKSAQDELAAFQYYTPLNLSLAPILKAYSEIDSSESSVAKLPSTVSKPPAMVYEFDKRIEELKPEAIASLTCSELDVMTSRAPEVMLEKLERFVGIDRRALDCLSKAALREKEQFQSVVTPPARVPSLATLHAPIYATEDNGSTPLYFEEMCGLYYTFAPSLLIAFIDVVHFTFLETMLGAGKSPDLRAIYRRAIDVLPWLDDATEPDEIRVSSLLTLLDRSGEFSRAVRLLTSLPDDKYWNLALDYIRSKAREDLEPQYVEMVQVIWHYCFNTSNHASLAKFDDLWSLLSKRITPLDFLALSKDMMGTGDGKKEPIFASADSPGALRVGLIKDQLLNMLRNTQNV